MPAQQYHINVEQGATFSQPFVWYDAGPPKAEIDLTGYSARLQVREHHDSTDPILDVTDSDPEITLGGANGTVTVTLTATVTAALPAPFKGVYDLELDDGSGVVTRLIEGEFTIKPEVTR